MISVWTQPETLQTVEAITAVGTAQIQVRVVRITMMISMHAICVASVLMMPIMIVRLVLFTSLTSNTLTVTKLSAARTPPTGTSSKCRTLADPSGSSPGTQTMSILNGQTVRVWQMVVSAICRSSLSHLTTVTSVLPLLKTQLKLKPVVEQDSETPMIQTTTI